MDNAPAFLFNVRQWLLSPSIRQMSDKQVRVYLELLCYSWLENPKATLPKDEDKLRKLLRMDRDEWEEVRIPVLAKFESDGNGRIFNERLMQEARFCEQKKNAGASGWTEARRQKAADRAAALKRKTEQDTEHTTERDM